jgi:DNA mismatch repair protein MutL
LLFVVPPEAGGNGGISVRGFIGKPGVSRSTRAQQIVFINGRAVENTTVHYALREGYHTALMKGQYPVTYLFIEMDPAAVDVNVHPAKREVRFRDPSAVKEAIVEAIRKTIETGRGDWSRTFNPAASPLSSAVAPSAPSTPASETLPLIEAREQVSLRRDWASLPLESGTAPAGPHVERAHAPTSSPIVKAAESSAKNFRILGVLGKLYVLMENEGGLVLVDQHAAHERILFEELRRRMEDQGVPSQRLLIPLTIQVSPRDHDWIMQNTATLQKMGIAIEQFGAGTFKIDALPQFIRTIDPLQLVRDIIDELRQTSAQSSKLRLGEDVIATTVCRHAVKANDYLREPELVRLIQDLLACDLPYCCPHGRPTMIQISYTELEKKFGRKA